MTRRVLLGSLVLFLAARPAAAQVVYQTDFEAPTFVDANLLGQDGWLSTNNPATAGRAVIDTGQALSGLRSARLDAAAGVFTDYFWHPLNFAVPVGSAPIVQVSWGIHLAGGAAKNSAGWGIDVFDDSTPVQRRVTAVIVDAANHLKVWNGAAFFDTGVVLARDAWHVLRVDMNYAAAARRVSVYVDGVRAATDVPFSAATTDVVAEVALYNVDGGGGDHAFVDSFLVASLADSDADGVPNPDDVCQATSPGEAVDGAGCSTVDTDADGVTNDLDLCANTPSCAVGVTSSGCPVDTDSDTVVDGCDNCLTMPNGPAEDNQADTDGDGIGNACDVCPGRWTGDVNGDGSVNGLDLAKFNDILTGSPASPEDRCAADLTDDLQVTEADVGPMIDLLLGM